MKKDCHSISTPVPRRARACAPYLNFVPCSLGRAARPFAAVFLRVADEEGLSQETLLDPLTRPSRNQDKEFEQKATKITKDKNYYYRRRRKNLNSSRS